MTADIPSFTNLSQSSVGGVISIELVHKLRLWGYLGDSKGEPPAESRRRLATRMGSASMRFLRFSGDES